MGADGAPSQHTGCRLGNVPHWGVTSEDGVPAGQRRPQPTLTFTVRGPGLDIPFLPSVAVQQGDTQALASIKPTVHKI